MLLRTPLISAFCLGWLVVTASAADAQRATVPIGAARIDITPELPIRLAGYQNRQTETTRVETPLFARALAIGGDGQRPVVLITVELVGVSEKLTDAVAAALRESHGIERARVAVCATHTHSGPAVAGVLPFMYAADLPEAEAQRVERYTAALQAKMIDVARRALAARQPGQLAWAQGTVDFAVQRRRIVAGKWTGFGVVPGGQVDHALPVLRATDESGRVKAVFVNYACHCTTLQGSDNFVHADWAGDAAMRVEKAHEGAVALVGIGCGADANPNARTVAAVSAHGGKIAAEVERLLGGTMRPLGGVTTASYRRIELPFDRVVTREELQQRQAPGAKQPVAYAAAKQLAQLDRDGKLPAAVPYPVQTWSFGADLAMVFLGGEVVSQYALRLRRELDGSRIWVNSYANAVPCYIPSRRMFDEGGYEVDSSMDYYGFPTRLAAGTEDTIIGTAREMVGTTFHAQAASKP